MSLAALAALLDHARRNVPFYADRVPASAPVETDPAGVLAALPLLTRQEVRRERVRLIAVATDPTGWYLVRSTGRTGEPVEVVQDGSGRATDMRLLSRFVDSLLGPGACLTRDLLYLTLHDGAASRAMASAWSPLCRAVKWNLLRAWQREPAGFRESAAALAGAVVTTLPSVADLLAARLLAGGAAGAPRPAAVLLSGEHLEPDTRYRVADAFECPVAEMYAVTEAGLAGTECPTGGGFHTGPAAWVEIVDPDGRALAPGHEGEVVLTPLANRAMPLLRYRTGDRAAWLPDPCGCGRTDARFRLTAGRRPSRLVTATVATVNVVRFAKLIAGLDADRVAFASDGPGAVRVEYQAARVLGPGPRTVIEAAVRSALGPAAVVRFERGAVSEPAPASAPGARAEPDRPPLPEVAHWLRGELTGTPGLVAAVLIGSALDPETTTRFSDLDLVLLFDHAPAVGAWAARGRALAERVAGLSVIPEALDGFERRSPVVAGRLHAEGVAVVGGLAELGRPSSDALRTQARYWLQEATATVWARLTSPDIGDPLEQAWLATKVATGALRFDTLCRGETATAARAVLKVAAERFGDRPWFRELRYALAVAREHLPPPPERTGYRYLAAALECVTAVADRLAATE